MAEIPVEKKKSGFPWWLIPLILLLLLLPLLYFCSRNTAVVDNANGNTNRTVPPANSATAGNGTTGATTGNGNANGSTISVDNKGTATGDRVTDVNLFGGTADKLSLVGRGVTLTKVKVNRVLSDRVFTVTSGSGEMFAFLDDKLNDGGKEHQIKMRAGQIVDLGGEFRAVPDAETKDETQNRDLNMKNYEQMKGQKVYLHTTSVADSK